MYVHLASTLTSRIIGAKGENIKDWDTGEKERRARSKRGKTKKGAGEKTRGGLKRLGATVEKKEYIQVSRCHTFREDLI